MKQTATKYQASIKTPFAHLGLVFKDDRLVNVEFIDAETEIQPSTKAAKATIKQICDYCSDATDAYQFDLDLNAEGTPFQKKVWRELEKIPYGQVLTYGQLAEKLHTSARAIGNACRHNPLPVVVPCHRVVSARGAGGYAGDTEGGWQKIKLWLLDHEKVSLN